MGDVQESGSVKGTMKAFKKLIAKLPPPSSLAPAHGSDEVLDRVKDELYRVAAKLGELRDQLSDPPYGACAWEINQTLRAISIAVDVVKRTKQNDPLPSLEDVQRIYRQNGEVSHSEPERKL